MKNLITHEFGAGCVFVTEESLDSSPVVDPLSYFSFHQ